MKRSWFSIHWMQHLCCLLCPKASISDKGNRRILKDLSRPCFSVQLPCLDRNRFINFISCSYTLASRSGADFYRAAGQSRRIWIQLCPFPFSSQPLQPKRLSCHGALAQGWHCKHGTSEQAAPFVIKSDWHKVHQSQRRNWLSTLLQVLNSLMSNTVKHAKTTI